MTVNGPVLLGGLAHSGKTQLRLMLDTIPSFSWTRQTYLWRDIYGRYGDLANDDNLDRCLTAIAGIAGVRRLTPDLVEVRARFRQGAATYPRLIRSLHEHIAARRGKTRWGDQMGLLELWADVILDAYPDARMIQLVRDPVQLHVARIHRTDSKRPGRLGWNVARWRASVGAAYINAQRFPDRFLTVRYEDLAADPLETLGHVCTFVEEDVPEGASTVLASTRFDPIVDLGPGFRASATRHFLLRHAGDLMKEYGYGLPDEEMSRRSRLRYATSIWLANRTTMSAWQSVRAGGTRE